MNSMGMSSNTSNSLLKSKRELFVPVAHNNFSPNRINPVLRVIIYIVIAVICLFFVISFYSKNEKLILITIEKDRAPTYNVKVLPMNLNDKDLYNLPKESYSYLAMIDAGSSGCRAHLFKYGKLGDIAGPLYVIPEHISKKVKPGLSSFVKNPMDAGQSLHELIEFLKSNVPEDDWQVTPIWLKATAGLRILPTDQSLLILQSVQQYLLNNQNSPFLFHPSWASVISGNEEGGYGWIAYNYMKKIIGPKRESKGELYKGLEPYAVIEMGGASSQVSQLAPNPIVAEQIPSEYRFTFTIESEEYHLYTHSYLGFGAEQAREQLNHMITAQQTSSSNGKYISDSNTTILRDPCLNIGYDRSNSVPRQETYEGPLLPSLSIASIQIIGDANNEGKCSHSIQEIFTNLDKSAGICKQRRHLSQSGGEFSIGCIYQPDFVRNSKNVMVFENFYYTSSAIGVRSISEKETPKTPSPASFPMVTTPKNILTAGNVFCGNSWKEVQEIYPLDGQSKENNLKMCFTSSFAYEFLVDGLKFNPEKDLLIEQEIDGTEVEWALGAAYREAAEFLKRTNLRRQI